MDVHPITLARQVFGDSATLHTDDRAPTPRERSAFNQELREKQTLYAGFSALDVLGIADDLAGALEKILGGNSVKLDQNLDKAIRVLKRYKEERHRLTKYRDLEQQIEILQDKVFRSKRCQVLVDGEVKVQGDSWEDAEAGLRGLLRSNQIF